MVPCLPILNFQSMGVGCHLFSRGHLCFPEIFVRPEIFTPNLSNSSLISLARGVLPLKWIQLELEVLY